MMWYDGDMGWWMLWGGLMMLAFWGGLIALAVWAIKSFVRPERGPLDVARERYARGEISAEEYDDLRRRLGAGV